MYNDVITLVTKTASTATDDYGNITYTETSKVVFAKIESIGMTEFYQANEQGLKPEIKFIISDYYDYSGEKLIEYEGEDYRVLRTFRKAQTLEIVCYKDVNET